MYPDDYFGNGIISHIRIKALSKENQGRDNLAVNEMSIVFYKIDLASGHCGLVVWWVKMSVNSNL